MNVKIFANRMSFIIRSKVNFTYNFKIKSIKFKHLIAGIIIDFNHFENLQAWRVEEKI